MENTAEWICKNGFIFLDARLSEKEKESKIKEIESLGFIKTHHARGALNDQIFFVKEL
jgi:hypothetical protein